MVWPGFVGPAYRLETPNAAGDRLINMFLERIEEGARQGQFRLRNIPGPRPFITVGTGPIRCVWSSTNSGNNGTDRLFVISGAELWEVAQDGSSTLIGNVGNDAHPAFITSNGFQLAIQSAGAAYIAPGGGAGVIPITDILGTPIFAGSIAFQDQYFIAAIRGTKQLMVSDLAPAGGTWDPANVAIKEGYADNISRVWVDQPGGRYLWIFGDETTEVWMNTAGPFPFSRVQNMVFPIGAESPYSVAGVVGMRFWYWRGRVWSAQGFEPQRISDYGVEEAIKGYSLYDRRNCEGFSWIDGGHTYYALSFPEASRTWVYDASVGAWHERLLWFPEEGPAVYKRWVARTGATAWGNMIVGDYNTAFLYILDPTYYYDAQGRAMRRERIAPYLTDEMNNDRVNRLTLDMQTGIGLEVAAGQVGYDPQVLMKYSIDRGNTYSNELQCSAGRAGDYQARVFWTQLNAARIGFNASIAMTDPVPTNINGAYLDFSRGTAPRQGK